MFEEQIEFAITNQWPTPIPQKKLNSPLIKTLPNNGEIDWNWSGEKIFNFIRAMYYPPYPLPKIQLGDKIFSIVESNKG